MEQGLKRKRECDLEEQDIKKESEFEEQDFKKESEIAMEAIEKTHGVESWVDSLLNAEFYVQCECGASTKGETNMYCTECKGKAFCEKCRNEGLKHKDHPHKVLQVYKSSHATCFRKQDIKKMMDITLIHSFINNSHHVIYIRPRKSNGPRNGGNHSSHRCTICLWELRNEADIYCSISCKVEGIKGRPTQGWKTRHKGTPHRAPLQ